MYGNAGVYGDGFDRLANRADDSTIHKLKSTYWTAKQALTAKLGKKEDQHLVASDAELDAKLEVYYSIKRSCENLLKCIEFYQDFICDLSQEENALGRFLKEKGKSDKTQAGKMMAAVGRAQGYTAQQRLALRVPLVRLYQELDVFAERAVCDTQFTIDKMERARHEYRGSLLWMKQVSDELDPDMYKRLDKFRTVQAQVKRNKGKFDKLKLDVLQKIDLLCASRCNLFSQVLANYQNCLIRFWDKTSKAHQSVSDSFKGYQHYEFTIIKDLIEPSKKLAQLTSGGVQSDNAGAIEKGGDDSDDQLISLDGANPEDTGTDLLGINCAAAATQDTPKRTDSLENLFRDSPEHEKRPVHDMTSEQQQALETEMLSKLRIPPPPAAGSKINRNQRSEQTTEDSTTTDLISRLTFADIDDKTHHSDNEPSVESKLFNDLFDDDDSVGETSEFGMQWEKAFGASMTMVGSERGQASTGVSNAANAGMSSAVGADPIAQQSSQQHSQNKASNSSGLLPSQLLDLQLADSMNRMSMSHPVHPQMPASTLLEKKQPVQANMKAAKSKVTAEQAKMTAWFNLFADIDPIANPDAVGGQNDSNQGV